MGAGQGRDQECAAGAGASERLFLSWENPQAGAEQLHAAANCSWCGQTGLGSIIYICSAGVLNADLAFPCVNGYTMCGPARAATQLRKNMHFPGSSCQVKMVELLVRSIVLGE